MLREQIAELAESYGVIFPLELTDRIISLVATAIEGVIKLLNYLGCGLLFVVVCILLWCLVAPLPRILENVVFVVGLFGLLFAFQRLRRRAGKETSHEKNNGGAAGIQ
jgi:hypothetical protein